MKILGIETSCDETAASVLEVKNGKAKILSNIISSQIKIHSKYGGVVPEVAARKHAEIVFKIVEKSLGKNKISDIDLIAATYGPGLVTSLRVGVLAGQAIANLSKIPFIGVNHVEAHLLSPFLTNEKIKLPALGLVVSGGHTELILMKNFGKYKLLGSTRDDAVGEAFDKTAKILGLGYPGGPAISREAEKVTSYKLRITNLKLPRPMISSEDFDFSFSGLKTAVLYLTKKMDAKTLKKMTPAIAAGFQQAAIDVLISKALRAAKKYKVKSIIVGGGVSANRELRKQLGEAIKKELPADYYMPALEHTGDNASMIAYAGYHKYLRTKKNEVFKIIAEPNLQLL
ncbi:MAG: tRNA (adenosine(37)-N6)-threonylcarbamoyltransferase complex transferase subunit TsaD [Patescibacteria group bacterium]